MRAYARPLCVRVRVRVQLCVRVCARTRACLYIRVHCVRPEWSACMPTRAPAAASPGRRDSGDVCVHSVRLRVRVRVRVRAPAAASLVHRGRGRRRALGGSCCT